MRRLVAGMVAVVAVGVLGTGNAEALPKQDFTVTQNSESGPMVVAATGVINALGRDVVISDTRDRFVFPEGALIINHQPRNSNERQIGPCAFRFHETGVYQIARGTGAYQGATGRGTYEVTVVSRGCGPTPNTFFLRIDADGVIDL